MICATVLTGFWLIAAAKNRAENLAEHEKQISAQLQASLADEAEQRHLAETHMRDAEKARDEQKRAAKETKAVSEFLVFDMIGAASPERNYGRQLTVREMLDRAARGVGGSFHEQPETEAAVRVAIGRAYLSLGLYKEAHEQFVAAMTLQRRVLGPDHLATLKTEINLAATLYFQGKYAEGQKLQETALAAVGPNFGRDPLQATEILGDIAVNLHGQGKYLEAQKLLEEVLDKKRRILGPDDESTLATLTNLAVNLGDQGKLAEAEKLLREAWKLQQRKFGDQAPRTIATLSRLAVNLSHQKRHAEAEKLFRDVLAVHRRVFGTEHPDTLAVINNLAVDLDEQGKSSDARALLEELTATFCRLLGPEHPSTITTQNNLAMNLMAQQRTLKSSRCCHRPPRSLRARSRRASHDPSDLGKPGPVQGEPGKAC